MGALAVFFIVTLFGGMLLVVMVGFRDIELARAEPQSGHERPAIIDLPALLARCAPCEGPGAAADADLARLERFLEAERSVAARFADEPTIENLFRDTG